MPDEGLELALMHLIESQLLQILTVIPSESPPLLSFASEALI